MRRNSFIRQLIFSYLIISILPLAVILTVISVNNLQSMQATMKERLDSAVNLVSSQVNSLIDNMSFVSMMLVSNPSFVSAVKGLNYDDNSYRLEKEFYSELVSGICAYAIMDSPYDVVFFNEKGYFITNINYNNDYNSRFRLTADELSEVNWLGAVQDNFGEDVLLPVQKNSVPRIADDSLTLVRAIRNPGANVGFMGILVSPEYLDNIFRIGNQISAEIMILSGDNTVIYASGGFPLENCFGDSGELDILTLEKNYVLSQTESSKQDVSVVMVTPISYAYKYVYSQISQVVLVAAVLLVITLFVIIMFVRRLNKPLVALTRQMKNITIDNLDAEEELRVFSRYNEIQYLYTGYNDMRKRLNNMLNNEIKLNILQMQERFNSLQSQINPHFLYNTLNVIGIISLESGNDRVYDACLKLSAMMRYAIAEKNKSTTTIGQELEYIKAYLELMRMRFEHRFEYVLDCQEFMAEISVPRLMIQPFVENIFEHAYDAKHTDVKAIIRGYVEKGRWYIVIEDNGKGIEPDKLAELTGDIEKKRFMASSAGGSGDIFGIGVVNTIIRLSLFFKDKFTYSIINGKESGIFVCLSSELEGEED